MANQNLSPMPKETKKKKPSDPCPICNKDLYLDTQFTQRVGLLGDYEEVIGWMCPYCRATFDKKDNLSYISGVNSTHGKA